MPEKLPAGPRVVSVETMRFLITLAIFSAMGYAFFTVPVGGKTCAEHASEMIRWDKAREKAAVAVVAAGERVRAQPSPATPSRTARPVATEPGERPPAHKVDERERRDLERLVVERAHK